MIFGWSGGLAVPEIFFLYPRTYVLGYRLLGRPPGLEFALVLFWGRLPGELRSCPPTMMIFKLKTWL